MRLLALVILDHAPVRVEASAVRGGDPGLHHWDTASAATLCFYEQHINFGDIILSSSPKTRAGKRGWWLYCVSHMCALGWLVPFSAGVCSLPENVP